MLVETERLGNGMKESERKDEKQSTVGTYDFCTCGHGEGTSCLEELGPRENKCSLRIRN